MPIATHWIKAIAMSQPQTMPGVPAYPIPKYNVDAKEGRRPSTANETQNVVHSENSRLNSGLACVYQYRLLLPCYYSLYLHITKSREHFLIRCQFSIEDYDFVGPKDGRDKILADGLAARGTDARSAVVDAHFEALRCVFRLCIQTGTARMAPRVEWGTSARLAREVWRPVGSASRDRRWRAGETTVRQVSLHQQQEEEKRTQGG